MIISLVVATKSSFSDHWHSAVCDLFYLKYVFENNSDACCNAQNFIRSKTAEHLNFIINKGNCCCHGKDAIILNCYSSLAE